MRELVEMKRNEYLTAQNTSKVMIAKNIVNKIQSRGGRFLKLDKRSEPKEFVAEDGAWVQVKNDAAEEKIKQCLREKRKSSDARKRRLEDPYAFGGGDEANMYLLNSDASSLYNMAYPPSYGCLFGLSNNGMPVASMVPSLSNAPSLPALSNGRSLTFPTMPAGNGVSLFQTLAPHTAVGSNAQVSVTTEGLHPCAPLPELTATMDPLSLQSSMDTTLMQVQGQREERDIQVEQKKDDRNEACPSDDRLPGDEDEGNLLSILLLAGRSRFTEQQALLESSTLTDAERADALSDLFGKKCSVSGHENKKPRRDLDKDSIDFLVEQMRKEIELIPNDQKQALMEAKAKARSEEFSDERLVKFLRCQGMNATVSSELLALNLYDPFYVDS